jgi:hypothetical protein
MQLDIPLIQATVLIAAAVYILGNCAGGHRSHGAQPEAASWRLTSACPRISRTRPAWPLSLKSAPR